MKAKVGIETAVVVNKCFALARCASVATGKKTYKLSQRPNNNHV